ncbi:hypothetical protein CB0101_07685 [Synechococcus sp. CB0101]|uniref:hypothetical protein n=1 Tax=Synechococcus sp. CB0101 TaxID=232348 RepID=UPI0010AA4F1A|nr:hypothetical protein [Synechococcus sp. CB0101]QCH14823.1 hypothetical protein CB0101_07685 [Synechococcus sp. CB0101]
MKTTLNAQHLIDESALQAVVGGGVPEFFGAVLKGAVGPMLPGFFAPNPLVDAINATAEMTKSKEDLSSIRAKTPSIQAESQALSQEMGLAGQSYRDYIDSLIASLD